MPWGIKNCTVLLECENRIQNLEVSKYIFEFNKIIENIKPTTWYDKTRFYWLLKHSLIILQGGYYLTVVSFRFSLTLCFINSIENSFSALLVATSSKYVLTSYTSCHFPVVLHVILSTQQQTSVSQNKQP